MRWYIKYLIHGIYILYSLYDLRWVKQVCIASKTLFVFPTDAHYYNNWLRDICGSQWRQELSSCLHCEPQFKVLSKTLYTFILQNRDMPFLWQTTWGRLYSTFTSHVKEELKMAICEYDECKSLNSSVTGRLNSWSDRTNALMCLGIMLENDTWVE